MFTKTMEALMQLNRTLHIKIYKIVARFRLFLCGIAKGSIANGQTLSGIIRLILEVMVLR